MTTTNRDRLSRLQSLTDELSHAKSTDAQLRLSKEIREITEELARVYPPGDGMIVGAFTLGPSEAAVIPAAGLKPGKFTLTTAPMTRDKMLELLMQMHERGELDDAAYHKAVDDLPDESKP